MSAAGQTHTIGNVDPMSRLRLLVDL